jgi:preprotein translocase subunit SecB
MVIEQTQEQIRAAHRFSRHANIIGIRLLSATLFRDQNDFLTDPNQQFEVEIKFEAATRRIIEQRFEATVTFSCRVKLANADSPDKPEAFRVECLLCGVYVLKSGYEPTPHEAESFHRGNVVFNCWPYFREFVQGSVARMDLPPPPIPFLRMHGKQSKTPKEISVREISGKPRIGTPRAQAKSHS